jgi:hypothetical protein
MAHITKKQSLVYVTILIAILTLVSCKKTNQDDNKNTDDTAVENNLTENSYSVNGTVVNGSFAPFSDITNGVSNCNGYPNTNCFYIKFSGRGLPKASGIYNIVWEVGNRDDAKEITVSYNNYYTDNLPKGIFSAYDSIVHFSNIPAVTQKAIVTVANGKVNIKFTNLKLYGTNDPSTGAKYTAVSISANISAK